MLEEIKKQLNQMQSDIEVLRGTNKTCKGKENPY